MNFFKKETIPFVLLVTIVIAAVLYIAGRPKIVPSRIPVGGAIEREGFQVLDDSDLKLSACPAGTQSLQTKNGDTDCCRGDITNFRCRGTVECTLSPPHDGIPNCLDALKARLRETAKTQCPSKFSRYYENSATGVKGCTSVARLPDGTGSTDMTNRNNFCPIFDSYDKARKTNGSCVNHKLLEALQCPERPGLGSTKEMLGSWWAPDAVPNLFLCKPYNEMRTQDVCYDDATLKDWWNTLWPSWREWINRSGNEYAKMFFCSVYKQVRIDKTLTDAQLKTIQIA